MSKPFKRDSLHYGGKEGEKLEIENRRTLEFPFGYLFLGFFASRYLAKFISEFMQQVSLYSVQNTVHFGSLGLCVRLF